MGWKKKSIALISVVLTTGIVLEIGKSYIMYSLDFDEKLEIEKLQAELKMEKAKRKKAEMETSFLKKLDEIERRRG